MNSKSDKKTTIVFISLYTELGGGEYAIYNLLKLLDRTKFHPIVVFNKPGPFYDLVRNLGIETVILSFPTVMLQKLIEPGTLWKALRGSLELFKYLKNRRVDIIHCNDVLALLLAAWSVLWLRIRVVYNVIFFYERSRMLLFNVLSFLFVKRILTYSRAIRKDLEKRTLFLKHKMDLIYYGIDVSHFRIRRAGDTNKFREELKIPPDNELIGMIARFDVWKGHKTFLKAASYLRQKNPDLKFVIVGGLLNVGIIPPLRRYYDDVMEYYKELKLEEIVIMIPHRDDIPEVLRGLDIFVCPSKNEPIPLIIFEAMASGVPIIAADSGGIPEQIENEKEGLLFRTDDARSLQVAVERYINSPDLAKQAITAARSKVEKEFELSRYTSEMEQIYYRLMD